MMPFLWKKSFACFFPDARRRGFLAHEVTFFYAIKTVTGSCGKMEPTVEPDRKV